MYDQNDIELKDVVQMRKLAGEWRVLNSDPAELDSRFASPDAHRLILSMPRKKDPEIVLWSARVTAHHLFGENIDLCLCAAHRGREAGYPSASSRRCRCAV